MNPAEPLNSALIAHHPAAFACLSEVGRRMFFPLGIPAQAAEARGTQVNATIGQLTDGAGAAMPLPAISRHIQDLRIEDAVLYAPQGGNKALRSTWASRLQGEGDGPMTTPFATVGLTHGLSLIAELFSDPDTDVLLPDPCWGNYNLIFKVRAGANIIRYPVFRDGRFCAEGMKEALAQVRNKALVVLNFPGNPTGYTPTDEEFAPWLDAIRNTPKPCVVLSDDAYNGFVYEPNRLSRSPFYDLLDADPERILPIKIDGATKELMFFGARVGFVTFGASGPAAEALESKIKGLTRANVSSVPALSQALVLSALENPDLNAQRDALIAEVAHRYQTLKTALADANIPAWPFNSGFFALVSVTGDPEALRQRMLSDGIGVVSIPSAQAIRIAYSSTKAEALPLLVAALARHAA